jgi:serine/threonine protein phosphatase 1
MPPCLPTIDIGKHVFDVFITFSEKQMYQIECLRKKAAEQPTTRNTELIAIGDVHGCATLLKEAIWPHLGSGVELILVGDLIDRSPEPDGDRQVIELVRELQANPEAYGLAGVTVLRGNHEQMLMDALAEDSPGEATALWEGNGGDPAFLPLAQEHQDWLNSLPLTAVRGDYLFVHAGVRPGLDLEDQQPDDLLWIRRPFLQKPHGLPYTVVHGHTFRSDYSVTHLPHRIGIDTGAYISGILTALPLPLQPSINRENCAA